MIVKAIYKPTGEECYVNMDYVVDIFPIEGRNDYVAYTFDNDRDGYIISQEELDKYLDGKDEQ